MPYDPNIPDPAEEELYEYGYAQPDVPVDRDRVPGGGAWVVPHYLSFTQLVNQVARAYRWTFDEALKHNRLNALAIRRDPVVFDAVRSRQIPVAQLPWHLEGPRQQDSRQAEAIDGLTDIIQQIPRFQQYKMHLLEAVFYGRYGVQQLLAWDFSTGKRRLVVRDHRPVNGDKLVFKYSGQPGLLVHANYKGTWQPTERGRAHFLTAEEREQFVIHKHEPEDADFYEGDLAGGVHGKGLRDRLYWFWYLKNQVLSFLMDYLERVGAGGFTIYFYEAGNPESLKEVKKAAETQFRNNTILFPRYRDGHPGGPGVQRVEPNNSGAALLGQLVENYFDNVIRRAILGQSLTSETGSTGLGSGVADLHGDTFTRIIKYDAVNLAETLTTDLVAILQKYNYPLSPPLRFVFDTDSPNAQEIAEAAQIFWQMGGSVSESQLREVLGLEEPQPGESILAKMGSLSPATAAGVMPEGVPMAGPPGPEAMGMPGGAPAQYSRRRGRYSRMWRVRTCL